MNSCKPLFIALLLAVCQPAFAQQNRVITVDAGQAKGAFNRSYNFCVGAGRANEGLRADWQRQLRLTRAGCGFRYIRFHGLLTDDMGVYQEDRRGNPVYNFQYIDELFDFLLSINMKPFVELGFMPNALASGNKTVFWWRGNITPPKDYQKWNGLIKHLVDHFTERYGAAEVKTWYFEVWNEPNLKNLFFSGDQADYFKLYRETANTIKSVSKDYRVGGPATAGNGWIPEMIGFCADNKVPVDFISTHTYGVKQGFLDQTGTTGVIVSQDKDAVAGDMLRVKQQIKSSAMPNLELHYTEWSASYTPSDPIHDSYFEAPYILDKIKKASGAVNSMSYWTFTDIFEEAGPRMTPFHGGFGLLNYQDIKKPAYYAFEFLNRLSDTELKNNDENSIACRDKNGNVQLLLWDFTITHPGDSVNDQVFYKRDLPAKTLGNARISVKNLKPGTYKMYVYKTGYRANDAYATYFDMHSPSQLTKQQVLQIKQANNGAPVVTTVKVPANGVFEKELPMRENDVYLVELKRLAPPNPPLKGGL
ncbi:glycoside hydrolase [Mucilaginibacter sp. PPCGB 2223]|uniref:GH39 family glycosyl hydrolase n=1 Tax=Mucilaginibacter sp. PPCGB 2223 TaxID=1886027 RepID=UPI000824DC3A|nr:glycoside hydrolase [Mucilaginibacter sp. PPCGB 2223]OCX54641.1 glycoside hydrolase [Mucilaginibacter sp. PPCGB 2223]